MGWKLWSLSVSHLEYLLVYVCERLTGQDVGVALAVRLPGDGGLSLGLLWHPCIITKRGADWHVQLKDGPSAPLCIRHRQKDQGLTNLPFGRLRVAIVPVVCVLSIVVILCILHVLVLTMAILTNVALEMDLVVRHRVWVCGGRGGDNGA